MKVAIRLLLLLPALVQACTCRGPYPTLEDALEESDIVTQVYIGREIYPYYNRNLRANETMNLQEPLGPGTQDQQEDGDVKDKEELKSVVVKETAKDEDAAATQERQLQRYRGGGARYFHGVIRRIYKGGCDISESDSPRREIRIAITTARGGATCGVTNLGRGSWVLSGSLVYLDVPGYDYVMQVTSCEFQSRYRSLARWERSLLRNTDRYCNYCRSNRDCVRDEYCSYEYGECVDDGRCYSSNDCYNRGNIFPMTRQGCPYGDYYDCRDGYCGRYCYRNYN